MHLGWVRNTETQKAPARDPIIGLVPKNLGCCEYASAVPKRKSPLQVHQRPHSAYAAATSCRTPCDRARQPSSRPRPHAASGCDVRADVIPSARRAGAAAAAQAFRAVGQQHGSPDAAPAATSSSEDGSRPPGRPCSPCPGPDGCAGAMTAPECPACRPDETSATEAVSEPLPTSPPKHSIAAAGRGTVSRARPGRLRSWSGSAARARLDLLPASISGPQKPVSPGIGAGVGQGTPEAAGAAVGCGGRRRSWRVGQVIPAPQ